MRKQGGSVGKRPYLTLKLNSKLGASSYLLIEYYFTWGKHNALARFKGIKKKGGLKKKGKYIKKKRRWHRPSYTIMMGLQIDKKTW